MLHHIDILGGKNALSLIRERGLHQDMIEVIAGAAGGPKWLILYHLDRLIFKSWITQRINPLYLIGSSIGAWRFAAISRKDPAGTLDKFKNAYVHQTYEDNPTPSEITRESIRIMNTFLGSSGVNEILNHPFFRLNIMTAFCNRFTASDHPFVLGPAIAASAVMNMMDRRLLGYFYKRALFYHPKNTPPFLNMGLFPIMKTPLDLCNFKDALLATGSIPLVMKGVRNISGSSPGVYRDGGIIDYHLDINLLSRKDKIVLYPHYMSRIIPGWFDKQLPHRKPNPKNVASFLLVSPSAKLVSRLPFGKISSRHDFLIFKGKDQERIAYWEKVIDMGRYMSEEFHNVVESGRIRQEVKPLDPGLL